MKKAVCQKCLKYGIVEEHHILPKSTFGMGETFDLCPNCHTDYHEKLGSKNLKNDSMEFHFNAFFRWLSGLSIVFVLLYLLF